MVEVPLWLWEGLGAWLILSTWVNMVVIGYLESNKERLTSD